MPKKIDYQKIIEQHLGVLTKLQTPSGLFRASAQTVETGYDKAWIRDNFYECLAFVVTGRWDVVLRTYEALLGIFLKHEAKIDAAILEKPDHKSKYLHARYHPETFTEFWDEWGNKQNDSVGAVLFMIGELYTKYNHDILNTPDRQRIVQKLVHYLESLEYWHDPDSGIWEEGEEIHASSLGACIAGLSAVQKIPGIVVNNELIEKGRNVLNKMLPRESEHKFVDLALLSLIYPFSVVTNNQANQILENIEYYLLKDHGVIRYKNDYYYNKNIDGYSEEAEWTFGLSWLAIIYARLGNKDKSKKYMDLALNTLTDKDEIPELYYANSDEYNNNTPLGWAESMFVLAVNEYQQKGYIL